MDTGAANEHVPLNEQGYFLPVYMVRAAAQSLSPALPLLQCWLQLLGCTAQAAPARCWLSFPCHHCSGCRHIAAMGPMAEARFEPAVPALSAAPDHPEHLCISGDACRRPHGVCGVEDGAGAIVKGARSTACHRAGCDGSNRCCRHATAEQSPCPLALPLPLQPSFSAVVGLVGSVSFFPLSVFFPMAMWIKVGKKGGGKAGPCGTPVAPPPRRVFISTCCLVQHNCPGLGSHIRMPHTPITIITQPGTPRCAGVQAHWWQAQAHVRHWLIHAGGCHCGSHCLLPLPHRPVELGELPAELPYRRPTIGTPPAMQAQPLGAAGSPPSLGLPCLLTAQLLLPRCLPTTRAGLPSVLRMTERHACTPTAHMLPSRLFLSLYSTKEGVCCIFPACLAT
jgi:hypothetical protein